jgi:dihydrofolate reductase
MIADGLVDELHLFVYPVTLGTGPRLFEGTPAGKWTLGASQAYNNGVLYLRYHA